MDRARHDLATQAPHGGTCNAGTFSLRSPIRPNRLASSIVRLVEVHPDRLVVRGLELSLYSALLSIKITACTRLDGAAPACQILM
jgi:tRNA (Thr-GGU) A37 N-methylase